MDDVLGLLTLLLILIPILVLWKYSRERNRRDLEDVRRIEDEIRDVKYQENTQEQPNDYV